MRGWVGWVGGMGREGGVGGGSANHTALFRIGKGIKSIQKALVQHHKAIQDICLAIGAVPCPIHPIGTFHWCHYHIHDFTGLAKCPPEKQISSHWPIEILCMDSP